MGTGFCEASVLHGPTTPYAIERVTFMVPPAKSASFHFKPNSSLWRRPVDAARNTKARSRKSKTSSRALISAGVRMVGAVRRFAL